MPSALPCGAGSLGRAHRLQPRPGALPPRRGDGGPGRADLTQHSPARGGRRCDRPRRLVRRLGRQVAQVLGGTNPVAGPYFNFTVPEPTGVVGILAPTSPRSAGSSPDPPAIVGGNAVVVVASETHPLAAIELAEALATSDLPGGVVNLLTGQRSELAPWLAGHMDVNALDVTGADGLAPELEKLAAENVKRVVHGKADTQSPWDIAAFLELKTVWHPMGQ